MSAFSLFFLSCIHLLRAAPQSDDLQYLQTANVSIEIHPHCNLSFGLNIMNLNTELYNIISSDSGLKQSILYSIHSRLFELMMSSFIYNIDEHTDNLWNEYYLHLQSISNFTANNSMTLTINVCVSHLAIQQFIFTELQSDGLFQLHITQKMQKIKNFVI